MTEAEMIEQIEDRLASEAGQLCNGDRPSAAGKRVIDSIVALIQETCQTTQGESQES